MRPFVPIVLLGLYLSAASAQPSDRQTFEAADVHLSPPTVLRIMSFGTLHGTRYEFKGATMSDLVSRAYGLDSDKVLGGPSWMELDRYDIIAKVPPRTTQDSVNLMLQSLLADRFHLVLVKEDRPLPAYSLLAGKHQGLKEADPAGETGCRISVQPMTAPLQEPSSGPVSISSMTLVETCRNMTMTRLAEEIRNMPSSSAAFRTKPVTDRTDLKGAWDFTLKYNLARTGDSSDTTTIPDAIEKQLGLKLETVTTPQTVIVVKSVDKMPTANSPEDMKSFPPLPTEFDVAEIKPSTSDGSNGPIMINGQMLMMARAGGGRGAPALQNGRVNLQGMTLKSLITLAWDVTSEEGLVGLPKFADSERFDVIAKAPGGPFADAFMDMASIKPLLRKLLTDQFKIQAHTEDRPVSAFVLTALKPKMTKSDSTGRTKFEEGPGPDGKDPRIGNPAVSRLVYCQNMTMAQFARLLPNIGAAYIRNATVKDATNLEGAFDFTISFSANGVQMGGGGRGGDGPGANMAAEPTGGITLFDALSKQLGLKLDPQKLPAPVVVIDHVEAKPVDN